MPDLPDDLPDLHGGPTYDSIVDHHQYAEPYQSQHLPSQMQGIQDGGEHHEEYSQQVHEVQDLVDAHAKENDYIQKQLQAQNDHMVSHSRRLVPPELTNEQAQYWEQQQNYQQQPQQHQEEQQQQQQHAPPYATAAG